MSDDSFTTAVGSLDNALIVVTASAGDERAGCLVGFHVQSSIQPERYCVWLSKANHTYRVALRSTHLGIHFLTEDDRRLAERFGTRSGDTTDKLAGLVLVPGVDSGVPLLADCPNRLLVRRTSLVDDGGDHVCVNTETVAAEGSESFRPLRLSDVRDLEPGHGAEERPEPPTERAGRGSDGSPGPIPSRS